MAGSAGDVVRTDVVRIIAPHVQVNECTVQLHFGTFPKPALDDLVGGQTTSPPSEAASGSSNSVASAHSETSSVAGVPEHPLDDVAEESDEDDESPSPLTPSKSARRRMRRRRQREATKFAGRVVPSEQQSQQQQEQPQHAHEQVLPRPRAIVTLMDLGLDTDLAAGVTAAGTLTPASGTITRDPGSPSRTAVAYGSIASPAANHWGVVLSPRHARVGNQGVVSTTPTAGEAVGPALGFFGAASSRLPPLPPPAPPLLPPQMMNSGLMPQPSQLHMCAMNSPSHARQEVMPGLMTNAMMQPPPSSSSVHPTGAAVQSGSSTPCSVNAHAAPPQSPHPTGSTAADTLRLLFGTGGPPSSVNLAAQLEAAVPERYED